MIRHCLAACLLVSPCLPLHAQTDSTALTSATVSAPRATPIRWWHIGIGVAAAALTLETLDGPVQRWSQRHRSSTSDDVASALKHVGQPEVYAAVPGAIVLAGLATGNDRLARSGGRMLASVVLAQALTQGAKRVIGRERPFVSGDDHAFHLFNFGDDALPSGHATAAFALATAASHELHSTPATIGLFTVAAGTAWSRLNDNEHWLTDVLVGGAVGVASAQFMEGRWTVFGLRPPSFLVTPRGTAVAWNVRF